MTVPLAWLGELGAGRFAQGVAGCCPQEGGPAPCPLPAPHPPAPAMTDPSACKTTIALISGGGKGCLRTPWAPGPLLPVGLPFARVRGPVGEGVGRLGGREAQSAMMRWDSVLHLRGPGCEGHPQSPHLPLWPSQSLSPSSFQKPPLPWPIPLQLPRGPGWEAGDSGYGPCLTWSKLGGAAQGWEGWVQAAGLSGAFGSCAAGILTPVTPETPPPPLKAGGLKNHRILCSLPLTWLGVTVLGRRALLGWWPQHTQPFYGAQEVDVGWGGSKPGLGIGQRLLSLGEAQKWAGAC